MRFTGCHTGFNICRPCGLLLLKCIPTWFVFVNYLLNFYWHFNIMKKGFFVASLLVFALQYGVYANEGSSVSKSIDSKYGYAIFYDADGMEWYSVWRDKKWGICDKDGNEIVPCQYDIIWPFSDGVAIVNSGAKWIKADAPKRVNKLMLPDMFEKIWDIAEDGAWVYCKETGGIYKISGGKFGLIDKNGNEVIPSVYDEVVRAGKGIVRVKLDNKYGYFDYSGKKLTDMKYDDAGIFGEDGIAMVNLGGQLNKRGRISGGKYGYVDMSGNEVVRVKYTKAEPFSEGLAAVSEDGANWGFIDGSGKYVLSPTFENAGSFFSGCASFAEMGRYGYIDRSGNKIVPERYDYTMDFRNGMGRVKSVWRWGFIKPDGNPATRVEFEEASDFDERGMAKVKRGGKSGYIDKNGAEIIPIKYDIIYPFAGDGTAKVRVNGLFGVVDLKGREIVQPKYQDIEPFRDGYAKITLNDRYGFVNRNGKEVVKPEYDDAGYIENGMVNVNIAGKWGYVDTTGMEIVPIMYDAVGKTDCMLRTPVKSGRKWGYVDSIGMNSVYAKFDTIGSFVNGMAVAKYTGKWGFVNDKGETVIGFKYDIAEDFHDGYAKVKLSGRYGYIDPSGNFIIPAEYQNLYGFDDVVTRVSIIEKQYGSDEMVPDVYDIWKFSDGYIIFKKDGKWGAMDKLGGVLVANKYNSIEEVKKNLYSRVK